MNSPVNEIRPPAVAGAFYPADPAVLRGEVDALLGDPHGDLPLVEGETAATPPKILIVPHAGYVYSGAIAAAAYRLLAPHRRRIRRVVILGPAHRVAFSGIALPAARWLRTPLGDVEVDARAVAQLRGLEGIGRSEAAHAFEHCLEVQLPFLQRVLGDGATRPGRVPDDVRAFPSADGFSVVPLLVGRCDASLAVAAIERLWGGDETLILISSDLSHYRPDAAARALDATSVRAILALEPRLDHDQACGATPVNAALECAAAHGLMPRLLAMGNSGDVLGDRSRVVGYCAVAFERAAASDGPSAESGRTGAAGITPRADSHRAHDRTLDDAARLGPRLLSMARGAIAEALGLRSASPRPEGTAQPGASSPSTGDGPLAGRSDPPALARLDRPGATFVTLTLDGALRGCIGSLQPWRALRLDVVENARASAFRDPRFPALSGDEFPRIRVEVSLLGAAEPFPVEGEADAIARLRPGTDGLILAWRDRRATFLPQVWDQLPDPRAFLSHLRRKAGLAPDFWAPDLRLSRYSVEKWAEPGSRARSA
ncbi:MAG: hypothetical protein RIS35_3490 [Pseudomonadota bacterium]